MQCRRYRFGVVLSVLWVCVISSYALYEWQAPFYKKAFFFAVISHPEMPLVDGAIFVTTPFLIERFFALIVLPLAALWLVLLAGPAIKWVRGGAKT
jgi:hypothetical protein